MVRCTAFSFYLNLVILKMMDDFQEKLDRLTEIFKLFPEIKLVYLFGSQASGDTGPLSDYDFAIYFDEKDIKKMYDIQFKLDDKISFLLKTDKIDFVILNLAESPELKYNIIKDGKLIYEMEPFRVLVEPRILSEYFDFHEILLRHGLTKY